jgi:hypothetical protein
MRDFGMAFTGRWTRLYTRAGVQILLSNNLGPPPPSVFGAAFHIRHLIRPITHEPKRSNLSLSRC